MTACTHCYGRSANDRCLNCGAYLPARAALAAAPQPAVADREACRAKQAEPDRGFDETPYDRGYVWGYRHGLRDGKAEVAPQPALADREALVEFIREADDGVLSRNPRGIADALLARGLRLPGDAEAERDALQAEVTRWRAFHRPVDDALGELFTMALEHAPDDFEVEGCAEDKHESAEDYEATARNVVRIVEAAFNALVAKALPADETMAWAVVGKDGKMVGINYDRMTAQHLCNPGERVVRVAIRVVEGGDDAA